MSLFEDIRFASRVLLKRRWMTAAAVVALALGIAANSAVFTFVNAVILRGVPFPDPDRVVAMGTRDARNRQMGVSYYDFLDWREAAKSFSDISLMAQPTFNVSEPGTPPERYNGAYVSASTFQLIGTQAQVGRGFIAEDDLDGARPVAVLGYSIWQSRYAGDPNVIGKTIRITDLLATVVGVMPPGMQFAPADDKGTPFYSSALGAPHPYLPDGAHFQLIMHHELAKALDDLSWFENDAKE